MERVLERCPNRPDVSVATRSRAGATETPRCALGAASVCPEPHLSAPHLGYRLRAIRRKARINTGDDSK